MSEISSGLVAVGIDTDGYPLVRLSDAEAIIAQKDAEILDQCRINGMGAERELVFLGQIERQSAALKLAKDALESCDVGDCSTSYVVMPSFDAVAIDEALAAINEVIVTSLDALRFLPAPPDDVPGHHGTEQRQDRIRDRSEPRLEPCCQIKRSAWVEHRQDAHRNR